MVNWYQKFGWKQNIFQSSKPFKDFIIVDDDTKNEILNLIDSNEILLLYGDFGSGKSQMLKHLEKVLKNAVYIDCDLPQIKLPFFLFSKPVLLLDEVQSAKDKPEKEAFLKEIKAKFQANKIQSVVMAQADSKIFYGSLDDRATGHKIEMPRKLTKEHLLELIDFRLGESSDLFSRDVKLELIEKGGRIPRDVLKEFEHLCIAFQNNIPKTFEVKHLKGVKNKSLDVEAKKEETSKEIKTEIKGYKIAETGLKKSIIEAVVYKGKNIKDLSDELKKPKNTITKIISRLIQENKLQISNSEKPYIYELSRDYRRSIGID